MKMVPCVFTKPAALYASSFWEGEADQGIWIPLYILIYGLLIARQ